MNKQLLRVIKEQNKFKKLECGVVASILQNQGTSSKLLHLLLQELLASQNLKFPTKKEVQNINITSGERTL